MPRRRRSETARKPRADGRGGPRAEPGGAEDERCRLHGTSVQPNGLRAPQARAKERFRIPRKGRSDVSVAAVPQILIVEDDAAIRTRPDPGAEDRGHARRSAADRDGGAPAARRRAARHRLLDLGLPDLDGVRAAAMMRAVSTVPVIVITRPRRRARHRRALDAGADDYVVKPFGAGSWRPGSARCCGAPARRAGGRPLVVGGLSIDPRGRDRVPRRASRSS